MVIAEGVRFRVWVWIGALLQCYCKVWNIYGLGFRV